MSFFDDQPRVGDAIVAPQDAAPAPRLGFLDGLTTAYHATTEVTNQLALDNGFRDAEQAQIQSIRAAGGSPHRSLNDVEDDSLGEAPYVSQMSGSTGTDRPYRSAAAFYSSGGADDPQMAQLLGQRNADIEALQKQYPQLGLKTYDQLWQQVQQNAKDVSNKLAQSPTTIGGSLGEFLGGAVGSMSPRSAPLNFATLGIPIAEGAGLAARMGIQAGAAGASDAGTQLLGGNADQSLLLGTPNQGFSFGQVAEAAAGGALGEAGFHVLGHAAGAIGRKLFPDSAVEAPPRLEPPPPDPGAMADQPGVSFRQPDNLPKVSPLDDFETFRQGLNDYTAQTYGSTRLAEALGQIESANVHGQLDAWDGPAPWEIAPRTDTAPLPDVTHVDFGAPLTKFLENEGQEAIARRIDPETFRQMDALSTQMDQSRQRLQDLTQQREQAADAHVADLQRQVDAAQERADAATGKRRNPAQQKLADLTQQRDDARAAFMDASTRPQAPIQRLNEDGSLEQVPFTEADQRQGSRGQLTLGEDTDHILAPSGEQVDVGHPHDLGAFLDHARGQLTAGDDPMLKLSMAAMRGVFEHLKGADKTPVYTVSREDAERIFPNNKAAGWYDPNHHYIVIKKSEFTTPAHVAWLTAHEGVHAQYYWAIEHSPSARATVEYMLHTARNFAHDNGLIAHQDHYGYTNAHEFISEAFTRPDFQRYLASVPAPADLVRALDLIAPRSSVATLWDAFLDGARRILRLPKDQTSLLESVLRYGEGLSALRDEHPGIEGHAAGALSAPETTSVRYQTPRDSVEMAAERANLMKIDEQQRDLAPLVSRAFAAAEKEWSAGRYNPDVIRFLRDLENHPRMRWKADAEQLMPAMPDPAWKNVEVKPDAAISPLVPPSLTDRVPELASRPDITEPISREPAAKQVQAVLQANAKDFEPEIERFQQTISKLLAEGSEDNTIRINGQELHLDKDRITVPTADGEGTKDVSVRSFLRDLNDDHEAYKAIGTCSRS